MKIFADGSLVGRTAAVHDPYQESGGAGYLQADAAELRAAIVAAHRSGWQVAAHAIGDLAIDVVLDAYAHALAQYPRRDPRHRIEHFAVAQPRQVARTPPPSARTASSACRSRPPSSAAGPATTPARSTG